MEIFQENSVNFAFFQRGKIESKMNGILEDHHDTITNTYKKWLV